MEFKYFTKVGLKATTLSFKTDTLELPSMASTAPGELIVTIVFLFTKKSILFYNTLQRVCIFLLKVSYNLIHIIICGLKVDWKFESLLTDGLTILWSTSFMIHLFYFSNSLYTFYTFLFLLYSKKHAKKRDNT